MAPGLLDLSTVTEQLISRLVGFATTYQPILDHPFTFEFIGLAPDAARANPPQDCEISLFLFHVAADKQYRNTYPRGGPARETPYQPLALVLHYLVTAYSPQSSSHEQTAMSMVLKCFHETPIVTLPGADHEVTLTLEPQSIDEIGRLWQATGSTMRLSAVYRVSVVFITAPVPEPPDVVRHPPELTASTIDDAGGTATVIAATADVTGLASIEVEGAGLARNLTTVRVRALTLFETSSDPPEPRHFRVIDGEHLALRVPLLTPAGHYRTTVATAPDDPPIEVDLHVAARVDVVVAGPNRVATVAVDDGGFVAGTTTADLVYIDPGTRRPVQVPLTVLAPPVAPAPPAPPAPGEVFVLAVDRLAIGVPAAAPAGRHSVRVVRDPTGRGRVLEFRVEVT